MPARSASPKRAAHVLVRADLLQQARRLEINLSRALEGRLIELLREKGRDAWRERNREAIEAYNKRVAREGVFSDGLRTF